ncbi:MAG: MFS transporter, partial [Clostridia bacterium]|nr:MFS transporter [Clostridia bacterium]
MSKVKRSIWNLPLLNSRTDRQTVRLPEMIFGYFLGPLLVLAMTCVTATYYLTFYRTYDDIVAQGNFLVLLPLISIIPMALANILVGIILGKTRTRQGKARPFILVAAPLLLVSGIVMFVIPYFSIGFRMAWMAITYNLFAALANPIYSNSHYLMVSLSTRNLDQRGKLSVVANIPAVAGNGLVSSILMPAVLSWIKAGEALGEGYLVVQNRWQLVMTLFAVAAFIGCCLEYLFTRERITEEDIQDDSSEPTAEAIPTGRQLKAAAGDKYWWIIMIFYFLY